MAFKLGSLFDGSGGFPLAGSLCNVWPVWAAEVEPYPVSVTRNRFPGMKHLGDVSKINGAKIEPVDIITFGSPCQDLSVAGKRAGLKHSANGDDETTRSGLFMEAVRIIKEMRRATNGKYPRFALWENVPGAFSSNGGEDFRIVLEELIKVVEEDAAMPAVPKAGWAYADCYCGNGWSLAYRVLDAQYWGVPQRRRRIYLVADFGGERAEEILFEREGLRGYFAQGESPWQGTAADAESCSGADDREGEGGRGRGLDAVGIPYTLKVRSGCAVDSKGKAAGKGALIQTDLAGTLSTVQDPYLFQPIAVATQQGGAEISENGICPTITAAAGMSGNNQPWIVKPIAFAQNQRGVVESAGFKAGQSMAGGIGWQEECAATLAAQCSGTEPTVCVKEALPFDTTQVTSPQNGCNPKWGDPCHPLVAQGHAPTVICKTYDARGNGDGDTVSTLTGDHENRITDYTSVVVYESHPQDSRIKETGEVSPTVSVKWHKGAADTPLVCAEQPIYCLQGNGIDRADTAGCNGRGWNDETCYTLNTIDRPAVAYSIGNGQLNQISMAEQSNTLDCMHDKQAILVCPKTRTVRYIVRRLTPTECARLQGFPDNWGVLEPKESLTEEEYRFWLDVRNTHASINGKQVKEYTEKQMLTWYNNLHTDSSEYKMWGNGIALPCALYVLIGISEALKAGEDDAWML